MAAAGAKASRPQPQTTGEPNAGPVFERHSRKSARPGYSVSGQALGANITQPLSAAPGYMRYLDVTLSAVGNNTGTAAVAYTAGTDFGAGGTLPAGTGITTAATSSIQGSPAAAVNFVQVKDAYGTPVFSGNGYEMLYLVPMFSGQVGVGSANDLNKWPSRLAATTGLGTGTSSANTGTFFYHTRIPFEIVPGYGCLAIGNSSLQPSLQLQLASSAQIYATAPATAPTLRVDVDENYWAAPIDVSIEPPGLGTTLQWTQLTANPTVGSGASTRIQFPRTGGYLTTLILVARNATNGARDDTVFPARGSNNRIRLYLDGVPVLDESIDERVDKMYEDFGGLEGSSVETIPPTAALASRPAGVIAYSFKESLSQMNLGHLDNLDTALSTTPGTLIEVECTPWGNSAGASSTITAVVGQIVPRGPIVQGTNILE